MCFVILSCLRLWVRRHEEQRLWRRFGRAVTVTAYGLPISMLGSAYTFFLALPALDPFLWTPLGFAAAAAACIGLGIAVDDDERLKRVFWTVLTWACLVLPALRLAAGGTSWAGALAEGHNDVVSLDILLLIAGVALWWNRARRPGPTRIENQNLTAGAAE